MYKKNQSMTSDLTWCKQMMQEIPYSLSFKEHNTVQPRKIPSIKLLYSIWYGICSSFLKSVHIIKDCDEDNYQHIYFLKRLRC